MDTSESFVKQKNHWSYLDLPPPFFFVNNVAPPVITYFFGARTPGSNQGGKHKAGRKTSCVFFSLTWKPKQRWWCTVSFFTPKINMNTPPKKLVVYRCWVLIFNGGPKCRVQFWRSQRCSD